MTGVTNTLQKPGWGKKRERKKSEGMTSQEALPIFLHAVL
jgi:hypothetical protein